jgi:putative ABC transport system permease protein
MIWVHAWRDLARHQARTLLSLLGIAIAAALLLDMVMLSGGIERSFGALLASRGFQLRVAPAGTLPFDTDATIAHADSIRRAIRDDPAVQSAGAVLGMSLFGRGRDSSHALVVYGVTPDAQGIYEVMRGRDLQEADSAAVLLSTPAALRLRVAIGDSVELSGRLDARTASASVTQTVVVVGEAHFTYDARSQPSIAVTLPLAQRLGGSSTTDRVSVMMVRVRNDSVADEVARRLRLELPSVSVSSIAEMLVQFRQRLSYFRQLSLILGSIALVITVLLVTTLLTVAVNERIGEIAALRAIGIARFTVMRQVVAGAMILTSAGGAAGLVLGLATARWLDAILTSFPGLPAAISFFVADRGQCAVAGAVLLTTGLVASIAPAWRAASAPIAATLRSDAA